MIIYFSATGNNKYLANKIAKQTNDVAVSIIKLISDNNYNIKLNSNENLGIVTPTYFWGLPSIVDEFLANVNVTTSDNNYIFSVATYGTTTGYANGYIEDYLNEKGISLNAKYSVKTIDTWTVQFDLTDEDKNNEVLKKADDEISKVINQVKNRDNGDYVKSKKSKFLANFAQILYDRQRKTKYFTVDDNCIACKICQDNCPIDAIKIIDNKVTWQLDYCLICFRCLHRCPQLSIEYKNKTRKNGQYINPHIDVID